MMHGCSHLILAIAIAASTNKKCCISYTHTSYETEHFSVHDHRIVGLQSRTKCFMESNQLIIELQGHIASQLELHSQLAIVMENIWVGHGHDRKNLTMMACQWLGLYRSVNLTGKNSKNNNSCKFPFLFSVPIFLEFQLPFKSFF